MNTPKYMFTLTFTPRQVFIAAGILAGLVGVILFTVFWRAGPRQSHTGEEYHLALIALQWNSELAKRDPLFQNAVMANAAGGAIPVTWDEATAPSRLPLYRSWINDLEPGLADTIEHADNYKDAEAALAHLTELLTHAAAARDARRAGG
jgi:hypothetical protein